MGTMSYFSVFDRKVGAYMPPFPSRTTGEAIRSFSDAVNQEGSQFARHTGDYVLWFLFEFDDENGTVRGEPREVIPAAQLVDRG